MLSSLWGPSTWFHIHQISWNISEKDQKGQKEFCKLVNKKVSFEKFKRGILICRLIYRQHAARKIQHLWDRYWYQPNIDGVSRAGLSGYSRLVDQIE